MGEGGRSNLGCASTPRMFELGKRSSIIGSSMPFSDFNCHHGYKFCQSCPEFPSLLPYSHQSYQRYQPPICLSFTSALLGKEPTLLLLLLLLLLLEIFTVQAMKTFTISSTLALLTTFVQAALINSPAQWQLRRDRPRCAHQPD